MLLALFMFQSFHYSAYRKYDIALCISLILVFLFISCTAVEKEYKERNDVLSLLIEEGAVKEIVNLVDHGRIRVMPHHTHLAFSLMCDSRETEDEQERSYIYNYIRRWHPIIDIMYEGYHLPLAE